MSVKEASMLAGLTTKMVSGNITIQRSDAVSGPLNFTYLSSEEQDIIAERIETIIQPYRKLNHRRALEKERERILAELTRVSAEIGRVGREEK